MVITQKKNNCSTVQKLNVIFLSEKNKNEILELFGKFFFQFCQESGYDIILQTLGANVHDFLEVKYNISFNVIKICI